MRLDIYVHFEEQQTNVKLDQILTIIKNIQAKEVIEMGAIDDLKVATDDLVVKVAAIKTVGESAIAAIQGISAQNAALAQQLADAIAAAGVTDPAILEAAAAVAAQSTVLNDSAAAIAAAIPANT
jgi:hypothetical protein